MLCHVVVVVVVVVVCVCVCVCVVARLRAHVIAFMCLVGAMRAMWRRYTAIVPSLFRSTRCVPRLVRLWQAPSHVRCALRRLVNEYKLPFPVSKFQMLALCASYLGGEGRYQAVVDTLSVEVPPALLSAVEYKQQEVPPNAEPYAKECAELYVHAKRGATQCCSRHVWRGRPLMVFRRQNSRSWTMCPMRCALAKWC